MERSDDNTADIALLAQDAHAKQSVRLWLRLLMTSTIVEKTVRRYLKERCNTTLPRFDVLANLFRQEGMITMSQLCDRLLVSNGNVSGVVGRLVEDGLVVRQADESDRRSHYVKLSKVGRAVFLEAAIQHEHLIDTIFADLDDPHMAALIASLDELLSHAKARIDALDDCGGIPVSAGAVKEVRD